jgi:hypothetical protein
LRFGRILIALVVLGAVVALGAYWIGPGVVPRAELHLLALDAESRFAEEARLPAPTADAPAAPLQPLILAVSNTGQREAGVHSITLSVPGWIRLHSADGPIEPVEDVVDEPLLRFTFPLSGELIEPGALPQVPAGIDRLWVSADLPSISCRLRWDGVPELLPAPPWEADALQRAAIFYSIEGERTRHTGVLTLRLDRASLSRPTAAFTAGEPVIALPGDTLPPSDRLSLHGERSTSCGAPGQRIPLHVAVWQTGAAGRGRLFVLRHEGRPRRILVDGDGDGRIEYERWDGDGNGRFEVGRPVSYPTPTWLMPADTPSFVPPAPPPAPAPVVVDTATTDTTAADTLTPPDTVAPPDTGRVAPPDTGRAVPPDTGRAVLPDTGLVRRGVLRAAGGRG